MNDIEVLGELYDKLSALVAEGKEQEARDFLFEKFDTLPEELQGKIVWAFLADSADTMKGAEAISKMQEQGLSAIKALEAMKDSLGK